MKITTYSQFPNITELGLGTTNETYLLVSRDTNVRNIFPENTDVVVENQIDHSIFSLKAKSGDEFRINQLGEIYRKYNVKPGDLIRFTCIETSNSKKVFFNIETFNRLYITVSSKGAELYNIERIDGFTEDISKKEYNIKIHEGKLTITFSKSEKKRIDSPISTDFYNVKVNDTTLEKGQYVIDLNETLSTLFLLSKSEFSYFEMDEEDTQNANLIIDDSSLQQIFYGAPGTGKSHEINKQTKNEEVIRTTFHPDSDYSTFVGAYKPSSIEVEMHDLTGHVVNGKDGKPLMENRIIYEFVEQAFLQAYINAWTYYAKAEEGEEVKKQYLVIEEINRGNCAQIFGDLFQLLDRNKWGFSEYPINADNDMKKHLGKAFEGLSVPMANEINNCFDGKDVVKKVLEGECLLLPNNLYIWATMNTSDQSLFPIDSAFKRRWDWKYMPIDSAKEQWCIRVNGTDYSWTHFLDTINDIVHEKTQSEDKQLGFYFCKAKDGVIDAETFVGKVLFYLWNDVFKDYGFDDEYFADEKQTDGTFKPLTFKSFYDVKSRKVTETQAEKFLKNLEIKVMSAQGNKDE